MIYRIMVAVLILGFALVWGQTDTAQLIQDGNSNLARGDCAFAQYYFQEALKLEEDNLEAMLGKGKALTCQGALALGIEEFQTVLSRDANNVDAHVQLALAFQEQFVSDRERFPERLNDALRVLEQAERLEPNNAEVLNGKGVIHFLLNDLNNAQTSLERAVSLASSQASLSSRDIAIMHINLGKTYRDLGELQLALQSFKRAVMLSPTSASAHNNVGNTYFRLGNCEQAVYELTQASNLNPSSLDATSNLAISMFECGDVRGSIPRFEQALDIPGALNFPGLYTYLARAYVDQGQHADAVRRAQQGALLPPVTAEAFYVLGQAYEARNDQGDMARAREAYQNALNIDSAYQPAISALARLP